jgi:hypothetical protein
VRRKVFAPNGDLMYDTTWRSYYEAEPATVLVGTKPPPKAKPPAKNKPTQGAAPPTVAEPVTAPPTALP